MYKSPLHIVIMESSRIIYEGLQAIICQSELGCRTSRIETLEELSVMLGTTKVDILIANQLQFVNREKEIRKIRKAHPTLSVAGIESGIMQKQSVLTDTSFTLYDSAEHIIHTLEKLERKNQSPALLNNESDSLTKREIEVLTGLVNGMLNKEIADALNISIHTVVRHRKNITVKTGIRSQSGLTIYAISKKIVEIEDIEI
ncbi:MAG: helix-turn-helix transcriptional regulator [Bacteroidales bacterium]|nr:helix-turn-helix transcriptional regulator [Bacteroidales bacterium]